MRGYVDKLTLHMIELFQLVVCLLDLLEETGIFDSNRCLPTHHLQKLDVARSEGL